MSLADIALVSQVLIFGNRRAFDTLVRKYQGEVRRFLLTLTAGDEQLTDDLAQETFIKAYTALESYKNRASFGTWLYRIAYNVFYDYIRSRKETCTMDDVTDEVDTCYQDNNHFSLILKQFYDQKDTVHNNKYNHNHIA